MKKLFSIGLLILACGIAPALEAVTPSPAVSKAFIKQLADGINARDLNAIRKLVHPKTLECMTPDKSPYYAWELWEDGSKRFHIPATYTLAQATPVDVAKIEAALRQRPVVSTHWTTQPDTAVYITYNAAPKSIIRRQFQITVRDGKDSLVLDCPTKQGMEKFHIKVKAEERRKKRLEDLWASLSPEDKKSYSQMAKNGKKIEGMKMAEDKLHLNMNDSLPFIEMIEYADLP